MKSNMQKGVSFARSVGVHLKSIGYDIEPEYEVNVSVNGVYEKDP